MNIQDKNLLYKSISAAVIIVALSLGYYLVVVRPKNEAAQIELQKQQLEQAKIDQQEQQRQSKAQLDQQVQLARDQAQAKLTAQYRAECIKNEEGNVADENQAVQAATTEQAAENIANFYQQHNLTGNNYINACVSAKLNGTYNSGN